MFLNAFIDGCLSTQWPETSKLGIYMTFPIFYVDVPTQAQTN